MTVEYRLTVRCQDCHAVATYTNERPNWRTWEPDPKEIRKAKRWLKADPDTRKGTPLYVTRSLLARPYLDVPPAERYVPCPACDGAALPYDATEPEPAETAAS